VGARGTGVVGLAIALRLTLLRNSLRSGPGAAQRQFGVIVGAFAGAGLALIAVLLLAATRHDPVFATNTATVLFTGLALGWVVLPIITFATNDLLDPARLSLLPLTRRDVATLLVTGSLVGVAPIATLLTALSLVVGVGHGLLSVLVAVIAALVELAFCVTLSRVIAAALSGLLRSRRGRDIGIALTTLVALSFQLLNPLLQHLQRRSGASSGAQSLAALAGPLHWMPPGLLASTPLLVRQGHAADALLRLLGVAALVACGVVLWERLVARSMIRVDAAGRRRRRTTNLSPRLIGRLLPSGRTGAVAAKDLRYLVRDPRRLTSQLIGVLIPSFAIVLGPAYSYGSRPGTWAVFVVVVVAGFGGLQGSNRFGLEGTSTWMLIASQTSHRDAARDLAGGDFATVLVIAPLTVAAGLLTAWLTGGWSYLPPALGAAAALLLVATASSSIVAVQAPYAVPDDPRNAFSGGAAGRGCASGLLTLALLLGAVALCVPLLALLLPALHHAGYGWALLAVGPIYGGALGLALRRFAAQQWMHRGPEVLQTLVSTRT
jgi:ABC-2 type transport system permease protein